MTPRVTVVCATYNARDAVRLTFASLFRYNPAPEMLVYVADNGSTDGALEEVRRRPHIEVVTLRQRAALLAQPPHTSVPAQDLAEHGTTLDWLVSRVATPFVLVLDSDVEFRAAGVVADLLDLAERDHLDAVGPFEPGWHGYRPRLAPFLLLLRTSVVQRLAVSFRGETELSDAGERQRWAERPNRYEVPPTEFGTYRTLRCYPTAARVFERLADGGHRWQATPPSILDRVRHFGHMSWGVRADADGGTARARSTTETGQAAIAAALLDYR